MYGGQLAEVCSSQAVQQVFTCCTAGHYVSLIKSHSSWLFFDDESVDSITESQVQSTFGSTQEYGSGNMDHGEHRMQDTERCTCTSPC